MDTGGVPVGRFAGWLWRRWRRSYRIAVGGAVFVGAGALVVAFGVLIGSVLLELDPAEVARFVSVTLAGVGIGLGAGFAHPVLAPVAAFGRGEEVDPRGVRLGALTGARLACRRGAFLTGLLWVTTSAPLVIADASLGPAGGLGIIVICLTGVVAGGIGISIATALLLRPVLAEVARSLPDESGSALATTSLVDVLIAAMASAVLLAAFGAGGLARLAESPEERLLLVISLSAGLSVLVLVVLRSMFGRGVLRPLEGLVDATIRVRHGEFTRAAPVASTDELGTLASAFNEMQRGLRERDSLHAAFGSYVDPALAQRLIESGSSMFDGEELALSVMFADVRDFTAYSESVTPAEAVRLLNRLFDVIVPVLHEHDGHANHYQGDGLLAVFGAPQPLERHAEAAVAAAVEIQRRVRAEFGDGLRLGIGINTGPVIAGTVGGGGRHEFTVIGDTVNTAFRVEQLTKDTGDAILITEASRRALSPPRPRSTKRGAFDLKGKAEAVTVHAVNPFGRSGR
jgi:class 3 adenylate cyclase